MILEIDTLAKTIILKSQHKLSEIESELQKILGKDYKNYTIIPEQVMVDRYPFWYPTYQEPFKITCESGAGGTNIPSPGTTSFVTNADVPFTLTSSIN